MVMPFGLTNAPSTFQSLINEVFRPHLRHFILVFFDDILAYGRSWSEHLQHLIVTFTLLRLNKLYAKRTKCLFGLKALDYFGHINFIRWCGGGPLQNHMYVGMAQTPKTIKALRGFLGLIGYYRNFVKDYGKISRPLTDMLKKDYFTWNSEVEEAFENLKRPMTSTPVLALPDFSKTFVIECDALGKGIGAVLMQEGKPLAFLSKALSTKNLGLSTYEKELLTLSQGGDPIY